MGRCKQIYVNMYVYTHIYIFIHVIMCVYIDMYIYIYIHIYIHIIHIFNYLYIHIYIYINTCTTYTHRCKQIRTYKRAHRLDDGWPKSGEVILKDNKFQRCRERERRDEDDDAKQS